MRRAKPLTPEQLAAMPRVTPSKLGDQSHYSTRPRDVNGMPAAGACYWKTDRPRLVGFVERARADAVAGDAELIALRESEPAAYDRALYERFNRVVVWAGWEIAGHKRYPTWAEIEAQFPHFGAWMARQRGGAA